MKKLMYLLLLTPFLINAQECETKKSIDPFTREAKVSTGFMSFHSGINNFLLNIDVSRTEINFFIALNKNSNTVCFDNSSTLSISYEGTRSKSNFRNSGSMNCEGLFHFNFRNNAEPNSHFKRLATLKLQTLSFTGRDNKLKEISLGEEDQNLLMEKVSCMIHEAKALLEQ